MKYSLTNKPLECILTESRCYNRSSKMAVKGVLWHSTAANNTTIRRYVQPSKNDPKHNELMALIGENAYNNDWNDPDLKVSVHAFIGTLKDGTITSVQTLPWDLACYGCGSGSRGSCNNGWIQFEICEDDLTSKSYFDKVYKEACELTAYLCKTYNLDPMAMTTYNGYEVPVVLCHKDANTYKMGSNHGDVMHWFKKYNKTMDDVRKDVAALMGRDVSTPTPTPAPAVDNKIDGEYKRGQEVKLSNNFWSYEFDCHGKNCCSTTLVDQKLVEYLQKIRDHFGKAVNVSSGYRCVTHNKSVNGATSSYHLKGQAADIYINGVNPVEIARYAEQIGVKGIGLYNTDKDGRFVHIDTRTSKSFWFGHSEAYRSTFQETAAVESKPNSQANEMYRVRKTWSDAASQKGAYAVLKNAIDCCEKAGPGYHVFDSKGNIVYSYGQKVETPKAEEPKVEVFVPYLVKVNVALLNYRQGPGTNYKVNGTIKKNQVYTIVEEKDGWGKLKSGSGWIYLEYTVKV